MKALPLLAAIGLSAVLAGCQTASLAITTPQLSVGPQRPRGITWKPVDIRRETNDRYVLDRNSRNNLRDNLADIARNQEQWNSYGDYFSKPQQ